LITRYYESITVFKLSVIDPPKSGGISEKLPENLRSFSFQDRRGETSKTKKNILQPLTCPEKENQGAKPLKEQGQIDEYLFLIYA
jgi:hypothetical protein